MAKTIWTTKTRTLADYDLADEPSSTYPAALKKQADALEKSVVQKIKASKQPAKKPRSLNA